MAKDWVQVGSNTSCVSEYAASLVGNGFFRGLPRARFTGVGAASKAGEAI